MVIERVRGSVICRKGIWKDSLIAWGCDMKKFLLAGIAAAAFLSAPAFAADMPVKGPVYKAAPAPLFNWTGFYVGATAGYAWGDPELKDSEGRHLTVRVEDGTFGGVAGYNFQAGNIVYGIEADLQNGPNGSRRGVSNLVGAFAIACGSGPCSIDNEYFGTVRARLGVAANQWLVFGTGGWAYGRVKAGIKNSTNQGSDDASGWAAGGGVEYAFAPNWTFKIEYLHVDLGKTDAGVPPVVGTDFFADNKFDVVRAGLNFKFGSN